MIKENMESMESLVCFSSDQHAQTTFILWITPLRSWTPPGGQWECLNEDRGCSIFVSHQLLRSACQTSTSH